MQTQEDFDRVSKFLAEKRRELRAEGYELTNMFDLPNIDTNGELFCEIDKMVLGFEIKKNGRSFNRFYGSTTFLFWDEIELTHVLVPGDDEEDYCEPIPVASEVIEGEIVHIDSNKHPDHYKAILDVAKGLNLQGFVSYNDLKSAARRYILSVQTRCNEKNLNLPRMSTVSLVR